MKIVVTSKKYLHTWAKQSGTPFESDSDTLETLHA